MLTAKKGSLLFQSEAMFASSPRSELPEHRTFAVPGRGHVPNPLQDVMKEKVRKTSRVAILNKVRNSGS